MTYEELITLAKAGYSAEQINAIAKMAEPAKAEPAKAEPAKAEPAKAEPAKAEPAKAEPAKAEPATDFKTMFDALNAKIDALVKTGQTTNINNLAQPNTAEQSPDDIMAFLTIGNDPFKKEME